ncbi:hypothetical protein CLOSTASPAR_04496 [[Clostridium] asparagiforme DSM 15981]|uniref:Uncharacterized protein n=1 Tax=[Clostridium] asparagiforme DSM 15981 TaxID=518636 RepID=C0D5F0_9FIRM|nr:hypothetical protein CLOSTASPAR_04496 [[Clostridium] asparagiforme DSM 15981]
MTGRVGGRPGAEMLAKPGSGPLARRKTAASDLIIRRMKL